MPAQVIRPKFRKTAGKPLRAVDVKFFSRQLELLKKQFEEELDALGDEVREEVVLPLCRKHKLTYMAGNGRIFIERAGTNESVYDGSGVAPDVVGVMRADLTRVVALLNVEVSSVNCLGYYVGDVSKEDL